MCNALQIFLKYLANIKNELPKKIPSKVSIYFHALRITYQFKNQENGKSPKTEVGDKLTRILEIDFKRNEKIQDISVNVGRDVA